MTSTSPHRNRLIWPSSSVCTSRPLLLCFSSSGATGSPSSSGLFTSVRDRRVATPAQRLAWLIILATIPVGIAGLALEHLFRTTLGRPIPAAVFLTINGFVLFAGE